MDEQNTQNPDVVPQQPAPTGGSQKGLVTALSIAVVVLAYFVAASFTGLWPYGTAEPGAEASPTPEVVASPTPDPLAGWKTYRNDEYGFGFKYPLELLIKAADGSGNFDKRYVVVDVGPQDFFDAMNRARETEGPPLYLRIAASEPVEPPQFGGRCGGEIIGTLHFGDVTASKCKLEHLGSPALSMIFSRDGVVFFTIESHRYFSGDMELIDQILDTYTLD